MNNIKQSRWVLVCILITLLLSSCAPSQSAEATLTPIPTNTSTPMPLPTATITPTPLKYSDVEKTYPTNATMCSHVDFFANVLDAGFTCEDVVHITGQEQDGTPHLCVGSCSATISTSEDLIKVYGVRVEIGVDVVLDGIAYSSGTKLTVDQDLNWIQVSSWE